MPRRFVGLLALGWLLLAGLAQAAWVGNPDGTVTDTDTGLIWARCAWGQTWAGNTCTGQATELSWRQALQASAEANLAGHTDWRMPNVRELESLVDLGRYDPAIDPEAFPNTPAAAFWSATVNWLYNVDPQRNPYAQAHQIGFADGSPQTARTEDGSLPKGLGHLRLVRSPGGFDMANLPDFGRVYPITVSSVPSGLGSANCNPNPVNEGDSVSCSFSFSSGYSLLKLLDGGVDVTDRIASGLYRMDNVTAPRSLTLQLGGPNTTTTLVQSAANSRQGEAVTLTATVTGDFPATGQVSFYANRQYLGEATLQDGVASLTVDTLPVGSHTLEASYQGDGRLDNSLSAELTHQVFAAHALTLSVEPPGSGSLECSPNPVGEHEVAECRVIAQPGKVLTALSDGGNDVLAQLENGIYRPVEVRAPRTLTATFASATSATQLSVSPNPVPYGGTVNLLATVTGAPPGGGTVRFLDGATELGSAPLVAGSASLAVNTLTVGSHALSAVYAGDGVTQGSSSPTVDLEVRFTENGRVTRPHPLGGGEVQVALTSVVGEAGNCAVGYLALTGQLPASPPDDVSFPVGLVDVALQGCGNGARITLTLTYPEALPAGASYWKYGPTPDNAQPHWYAMPTEAVRIEGNTVSLTLTDGAIGDDDLRANGEIVDIGGVAVVADAPPPAPQPLPVPVLGLGGLGLLAAGLLGTALTNRRRTRCGR